VIIFIDSFQNKQKPLISNYIQGINVPPRESPSSPLVFSEFNLVLMGGAFIKKEAITEYMLLPKINPPLEPISNQTYKVVFLVRKNHFMKL
jgi:hypothetical protein